MPARGSSPSASRAARRRRHPRPPPAARPSPPSRTATLAADPPTATERPPQRDADGDDTRRARFQLDADGNGSLAPLTDGLLVLRHLFSFTGPTLVNGAAAGNCTRCDGPAVQTYLSGLGLVLDIDGNGSLGPLTDGLLVLRYLFSFTGPTLVNGAIGANCTRCDAPAITTYLQSID